jgi:hypothetical protein
MELILFWLIMGGVVGIIANSKGRGGCAWFLYGLLIWPIALVHILVSPNRKTLQHNSTFNTESSNSERVKCPHCAELILSDAKVCRYCGREVSFVQMPVSDKNATLSRLDGFTLGQSKDTQPHIVNPLPAASKKGWRTHWIYPVIVIAILAVVVAGIRNSRRDNALTASTTTNQQTTLTTSSLAGDVQPTPAAVKPVTLVSLAFDSDPQGATLSVNGVVKGKTPLTIEVDIAKTITYTLRASEPYPDYSLYKVFSGTITPTKDEAITVWIDRTSAEEQAQQREAYTAKQQLEQEQQPVRDISGVYKGEAYNVAGDGVPLRLELVFSSEHYYAANFQIVGLVTQPDYMVCELKDANLNCLTINEDANVSFNGTLSGTSYNGTINTANSKLRFSLNKE